MQRTRSTSSSVQCRGDDDDSAGEDDERGGSPAKPRVGEPGTSHELRYVGEAGLGAAATASALAPASGFGSLGKAPGRRGRSVTTGLAPASGLGPARVTGQPTGELTICSRSSGASARRRRICGDGWRPSSSSSVASASQAETGRRPRRSRVRPASAERDAAAVNRPSPCASRVARSSPGMADATTSADAARAARRDDRGADRPDALAAHVHPALRPLHVLLTPVNQLRRYYHDATYDYCRCWKWRNCLRVKLSSQEEGAAILEREWRASVREHVCSSARVREAQRRCGAGYRVEPPPRAGVT